MTRYPRVRGRIAASAVIAVATVSSLIVPRQAVAGQFPQPIAPKSSIPLIPGVRAPSVVSFRVIDGPYLSVSTSRERDTIFEATLENYDPAQSHGFGPSLWADGCRNGGLVATSQPGGSPYRVRWEFGFSGRENSGRTCVMQIQAYVDSPKIAVGSVTLPTLQTYTISSTADLLGFTTPSGVHVAASASKGILPCELGSVGTAGTFSTGVVTEAGDLTFQLRNGVLQEDCEFKTSNALVVKPEWAVTSVNWQFTTDANCSDGNSRFATQAISGQTVTFFFDEGAIFKVDFQVTCRPDSKDSLRNSHLYKARLADVQLVGPPGHRWQDAFK
jgi:hypothetical protein